MHYNKSLNSALKKYSFFLFLSHFFLLHCSPVAAEQVEDIFGPFEVSKSNISTWATPLAYKDGKLFTCAVTIPKKALTGTNLQTIILKGTQINNKWSWSSNIIDSETIDDQWHNVPSLGIDKNGYIHIAYNMHNMPWQYSISESPLDISSFRFLGDKVSSFDKYKVKHLKQSNFPNIGNAAIPNNQVTYPAFFNDKNDDLYITYRFAAKPKRTFIERGLAAGIAKYDINNNKWTALGGDHLIDQNDADFNTGSTFLEHPFALNYGWTAYLPRLAFDSSNNMHIAWAWRKGGPGSDHTSPSYAYLPNNNTTFFKIDGTAYQLPVTEESSSKINQYPPSQKYYGPSQIIIDSNDNPIVLLQPIGGTRSITVFNRNTKQWSKPEKLPYSAVDFNIDSNGNWWAIAHGLKVFKKNKGENKWKLIYADKDADNKDSAKRWCQPKSIKSLADNVFFVHSQSCDFSHIKVTSIKW